MGYIFWIRIYERRHEKNAIEGGSSSKELAESSLEIGPEMRTYRPSLSS